MPKGGRGGGKEKFVYGLRHLAARVCAIACYPRAFDFLRQRTALRESIMIVVSPLISLMQDQVRAMIERNVTAVYIGGADYMLEAEICAGNYQFVYCSHESLLTDNRWHDML